MSEDVIWEQFTKLEERVSELIGTCRTLEEEKADLTARLAETEEAVSEKESENRRLLDERSAIRSKVDNMLLKLEGRSPVEGS